MKKNILLICNYFAPDNTIAAVRTSKLAKYLRQSGYEVQVIAEKKDTAAEKKAAENSAENKEVVYEKSTAKNKDSANKIYNRDSVISKLKASGDCLC